MTFSQYVQSFICVDAPQCEEVKAWRVLNDAWKRAMSQVQFYWLQSRSYVILLNQLLRTTSESVSTIKPNH